MELCALPVENVWYQLGIWLGVEKDTLCSIKESDFCETTFDESIGEEKLKDVEGREMPKYLQMVKMFKEFISIRHVDELSARLSDKDKLLFNSLYNEANSYQPLKWKELIANQNKKTRILAQKLLMQKWLKRVKVVQALVKVGCYREAERICSARG